MNISLARQHYSMTKENSVGNTEQNALAIKLAMEQLLAAMNVLAKDPSPEEKEQNFELALTRIYILQKCLGCLCQARLRCSAGSLGNAPRRRSRAGTGGSVR